MSRPERVLHPERSPLDQFGYVLRKWRKRRGLSLARLAARVGVSTGLIQLTEVAQRHPTYTLAERCEAVLDAGGEILAAWQQYAEPYDTSGLAHPAEPTPTGTTPGNGTSSAGPPGRDHQTCEIRVPPNGTVTVTITCTGPRPPILDPAAQESAIQDPGRGELGIRE